MTYQPLPALKIEQVDVERPRDTDIDFINLIGERTKLLDNLWLGGYPDTKLEPEIKYSVCLVGQPRYYLGSGQKLIATHFDDCPELPNLDFLHGIAELVNRLRKSGPVLVHCAMGLNRSALVVGLALIKDGWEPEDAVQLMRSKRALEVLHNKVFLSYLLNQAKQDNEARE